MRTFVGKLVEQNKLLLLTIINYYVLVHVVIH